MQKWKIVFMISKAWAAQQSNSISYYSIMRLFCKADFQRYYNLHINKYLLSSLGFTPQNRPGSLTQIIESKWKNSITILRTNHTLVNYLYDISFKQKKSSKKNTRVIIPEHRKLFANIIKNDTNKLETYISYPKVYSIMTSIYYGAPWSFDKTLPEFKLLLNIEDIDETEDYDVRRTKFNR